MPETGGVLVISTPSLNAPLFKLGALKKFDQRVGHIRRYSPDSLTRIIKKSGFLIQRVKLSEGIIRNCLFTIWPVTLLLKIVRGPIAKLVSFFDKITIPFLGESDIQIIAVKP